MSKPGFYLTRQATKALSEIYKHSEKQWGRKTADHYLADIYAVMQKAAGKPDIGKLREPRTAPFMMVAAREHFIVYDLMASGVVILTLLHQHPDIEQVIADMEPDLLAEIEVLRKTERN